MHLPRENAILQAVFKTICKIARIFINRKLKISINSIFKSPVFGTREDYNCFI